MRHRAETHGTAIYRNLSRCGWHETGKSACYHIRARADLPCDAHNAPTRRYHGKIVQGTGYIQAFDRHSNSLIRWRRRLGIHLLERTPEHLLDKLLARNPVDRLSRNMLAVAQDGDRIAKFEYLTEAVCDVEDGVALPTQALEDADARYRHPTRWR